MNLLLTLALLTTPDGYRIHYPKGLESDARMVAGFAHQAKAAMVQEFARFQPAGILKSISLDVYLHDRPGKKAGVGDMLITGAAPCGSHVCKKYAYSIDLLAPSLWPPNPRHNEAYFLKNIIHEYSTIFLEIITRNKGSGWSLFQSDTPSWFVQGYEEFLGLVHSKNQGRIEEYKKEFRSNPNIIRLKPAGQKNIITAEKDHVYTAGALLLMYMHETFGRGAVQRILSSQKETFYGALEKELGTSVEEFYKGWQRWSAKL